jgi:hypothetical protein
MCCGSEGFAHQLFVGERAVRFGGVEERDAAFDRCANERDHLAFVRCRSVAIAHPHAAEPDRRDFQVAAPQSALLHFVLSFEASSQPGIVPR